jgi:signal transduction histidine kinase
MLTTKFFLAKVYTSLALLGSDTLWASDTTDIFSFVIVCILIIALFYSLITLRSQNRLIAAQNEEILLKNKQLQIQNNKLKKINEEKTNLIGIVSHDLKSPFNRIFALLNLLKLTSTDISDEQNEYLSKMHQVIKDGLALIRNLLDIRAIEDEGIKMAIEDIDVVRLIKEILTANKPLADIKQIKFKLIREVERLDIISDKLYLSRIIENLLSNALKFSENKTTIEIKVGNGKAEDFYVEFIDQGPGVSSEDLEQMFQKFQILSARPTDGESSTGLGLSIVKSLVDKLGGEILCESILGGGAKFTIKIPLKISNDD